MRAIALVDKIEFQFSGNVARNAVTLGDVDNDGCYELVVGNSAGDVAIFKGKEKVQTFSELGFVVCTAVGDIFNKQQNNLVIVTADGWFYIYENTNDEINENIEPSQNVENPHDCKRKKTNLLKCIHIQRIPANVKNIVLGDIDEDGKIEVIFGLTDRVVRTYRWLDEIDKNTTIETRNNSEQIEIPVLGRLVALNKWECANQIGSITLHHSIDNKPAILVAQPGGTFMRIRCQPDDGSNNYSSLNFEQNEPPTDDPLSGSTIDYQYLCRSRMRNENISTEIIGDFKTVDKGDGNTSTRACPYAVATLDGTIMLVQDEEIRWEIAVNHQIFALTKLDVTGRGVDDIVVCSWDGQTYFLDQDKNCVSFNLDEPVQAFGSGYYNLSTDQAPVTALVYVTFKNTIILYYDIPLKDMVIRKYNIDLILIDFFMKKNNKTRDETEEFVRRLDRHKKSKLISFLLYGDDDNK